MKIKKSLFLFLLVFLISGSIPDVSYSADSAVLKQSNEPPIIPVMRRLKSLSMNISPPPQASLMLWSHGTNGARTIAVHECTFPPSRIMCEL